MAIFNRPIRGPITAPTGNMGDGVAPGTYQNDPVAVQAFTKKMGQWIVGLKDGLTPEEQQMMMNLEKQKGRPLTGLDQGRMVLGRTQMPSANTTLRPGAPIRPMPTPRPVAPGLKPKFPVRPGMPMPGIGKPKFPMPGTGLKPMPMPRPVEPPVYGGPVKPGYPIRPGMKPQQPIYKPGYPIRPGIGIAPNEPISGPMLGPKIGGNMKPGTGYPSMRPPITAPAPIYKNQPDKSYLNPNFGGTGYTKPDGTRGIAY